LTAKAADLPLGKVGPDSQTSVKYLNLLDYLCHQTDKMLVGRIV